MKKIEIKKYIPYFILIIIFGIFQVFFNTEIPKYLSRNINIGIINKGVERVIYENLSSNTYDMLKEYISDKSLLENSYILNSDNTYSIKNISKEEKNKLEKETKNILEKISGSNEDNTLKAIIANENENLGINNGLTFIKSNSLKMLLIAITGTIFVICSNFTISFLSAKFSKELRSKIFKKVEEFSTYNLEKFGISSLLTRTTNDIMQIQNALNMILKFAILSPLFLIIASSQAYSLAPELMKILLYLSLTLIIALAFALIFLSKYITRFQKLIDKTNNVLREILTGKRVIRAFLKQDYETNKYTNLNNQIKSTQWPISLVQIFIEPFAAFLLNISAVLIVYYTAKIIPITNIGLGSIMAFIQYAIQIMISFIMLTTIFFFLPNLIVSLRRINEVLNEDITIKNINSNEKLISIDKIEFKNVFFSYENSDDYVLSNINFEVKKGETLGIIGSTGSGKSTISKLLLRFLDLTKGEILINNKSIKDYSLFSLRDNISYTPQNAKILSGSILENVAYKDSNPNLKKVQQAIEIANATEFADINKNLNQSGSNLSGGQKQRIQIARSIYKNSDLLIFDDSFSALDNKTDKKIRENIKNLNNIKIIISQKISTIKDTDKILVLNEGLIDGYGKHEELLNTSKIYKEIYQTQTGGQNE